MPVTVPTPVKPGYKTTEFWLTVATVIAAAAGQLAGVLPPPWGAVLATVSSVVYAVIRGWTKTSPNTQ